MEKDIEFLQIFLELYKIQFSFSLTLSIFDYLLCFVDKSSINNAFPLKFEKTSSIDCLQIYYAGIS